MESLIYAAIVVLLGAAIISFILNIIEISEKNRVMQEVSSNARITMDRIIQEINSANSINAASDFGINLADNPGDTLSLGMRDSSLDPTEFDVSSGILRIKQGSGSFEELSAEGINITNLTFTNLSSPNGRSKNIGILLTVEHPNPENNSIYEASVTLRSAAELKDR